jgi:cyclopropane fatty-acyl-phospholipid synthase-like methyltransferase
MPAEQDFGYLHGLYEVDPDPWQISSGFYEQRKRQLLLGCLPAPRYASAFEPACSNGVLSLLLARRCDRLLAVDVSERAVQAATERLADQPNVLVRQAALPEQWPDDRFDLVVLSEFGYFLPVEKWQEVVERTASSLTDGATVVACHWRADFAERLAQTELLHELLHQTLPLRHVLRLDDEDFLVDVWTSAEQSAAQREGRR